MPKTQRDLRNTNRVNMGNKKKKRKKKHPILKAFFFLILFCMIIGIGLVYGFVQSVLNGAGALSREDFVISEFTTTVYDKDGNVYSQLFGKENRTYVSLDETSPHLKDAFIAIEDERFENHFGIDIKRTGAAVVKYVTTGNSDFGGSTITQQLIKKVTDDDSRSWQRKAREIVRAIQIERWLSKDEIIEMYMNLIYLGEGAYGVEKAAYTYFDKGSDELSIAECALIAGLAQSPEGKNPYKFPDKAIARQRLVLGKMRDLGKITQAEYDEAYAQELEFKKGTSEIVSINSYFVDALVSQLAKDIEKEKGVSALMAEKMIYSNGLKIYTTVDPKIQEQLEKVYADQSYFKLSNGNYDPEVQSAMVVSDYRKGNVVGLIGGAGEKTTLRGLNRATMMTRAPGSSIKPVAVYAPGIDKGIFTAATTFDDVPFTYKVGGSKWSPKNIYTRYRGLTSVRKAVEISSNVIAAKAFLRVGIDTSFRYLENFGYTSLTNSDRAPGALALGGLTKGVSPYEHAAAYGAIANSGIYVEPKLYTKVLDMNSQVFLEKKSEIRQVISEQAAYMVTNLLQDVVSGAEGSGGSAKLKNMAVAGKTGTTNDSKDRWFVGYTPYYVGATWVGYDIQREIKMPGNPAAKLWNAVMQPIHEGLSNPGFVKPNGIVYAEVCADSGLLCTEACRNDRRGSRAKSEMFVRGTVPTEYCTVHKYVTVCKETFKLMNPVCISKNCAIDLVFLDREYEETPKSLPRDWDYEVPKTYCEYHYCPIDEYGNFIEPEPEKPVVNWDDYIQYDDEVEPTKASETPLVEPSNEPSVTPTKERAEKPTPTSTVTPTGKKETATKGKDEEDTQETKDSTKKPRIDDIIINGD